MEGLHLFLMLFLVVGFAAGAGAVWLVLQGRTSTAYARARSEIESTLTEMSEQLRGKEEQVLALQSTLDQGASATGAPQADVEEVAASQTVVENEKAALAASLQERDQRLAALESELAGAQAELASLTEPVVPPPLPPPPAAPASDASVLQILARPIEEHLAELRVRLEQLSAAPRSEPALSEDILRNFARPIEEKISELGQRLEEIGAARPEPVLTKEVLQGLVRPMGEQLADMRLRLERMETDQARSRAASAGLHSHNAQLTERLHHVTDGLCELRGALARSLDLCSLAVATAGEVEVAPEPEPRTVTA